MNDFTLTERRTLSKLLEIARMLNDRANKIADSLGPDVDGVCIFGEEHNAIVEAIIVALNLDPSEWNEDLIYDLISQRESFDTFSKFAVRVGGDYTGMAYTSGHGYFFEHEKPELAKQLAAFIGGDRDE